MTLLLETAASDARVTVTVNLGLLSCRSPLPSYFQQLYHHMHSSDPVVELLRMLDRSLLRARLASDTADRMLPSWPDIVHDFVRIHGLDSPIGLHWLFTRIFPEMLVRVRRIEDDYSVPYNSARLGFAELGRCSFGDTSRLTVQELEVALVCEESRYGGEPWLRVAERRIRRFVLPWLDEVCMTLTVSFVLLDSTTFARLARNSHLGYDPLWKEVDDGGPPAKVTLYRGALPRIEPGSEALDQVLATGGRDAIIVRARHWDHAHELIGSQLRHGLSVGLTLILTSEDQYREYDVDVRWGARSWWAEEPFEIQLSHDGIPKPAPSPRHHPNLWLRLRDEARVWIADRATDRMMAAETSGLVSDGLVDRLVTDNDQAGLHALLWSTRTPTSDWEPQAWRRFHVWSET